MIVGARFHDLLTGAAFLGSTAFLLADDKPLLIPIAFGLVGLAWVVGRPIGGNPGAALPRSAGALLVFGAIAYCAYRVLVEREVIVSVLGQFLVLITLIKLFDRRSPRDDAQALALALCAVLAALLTGASLVMALVVAVFIPIAVSAAMLWQIIHGQHTAGSAPVGTSGAARSVGPLARHIALTTGFTVAVCMLAATVVFVLAPRGLQVGQPIDLGPSTASSQGFTDQIQLGRAGLLSEDTTPVLDVEFTDAMGYNLGSFDRAFYLRGTTRFAYDSTTGGWSALPPDKESMRSGQRPRVSQTPVNVNETWPVPGSGLYNAREEIRGSRIIQRVTMRPVYVDRPRYLFTLWRPLLVTTEFDARVDTRTFDASMALSRSAGVSRRVDPFARGYRYSVVSVPDDARTLDEPAFTTSFEAGPIHDLAVSLLRDAEIDPEAIETSDGGIARAGRVFCEHLRRRYTYSLELIAPRDERDAIEYFLFESRQGNCEYFASALVAMCQSVGIHARLVAGYVAAEFNDLTGRYIVRESNAHAWAEVHVGEGRWVTLDPTPPDELYRLHRPAPSVFAAVWRWWDAIEFAWSARFVSFDRQSQDRLLGRDQSAGAAEITRSSLGERIARWFRGGPGSTLGPVWRVIGVVTPVVLIIAALVIAIRAWRRRRRARLGGNRSDPELERLLSGAGFYADSLRALARAGHTKPSSLPPVAHAAALARSGFAGADDFARLSDLYYRIRFGRRPLSDEEGARARQLLEALRGAPGPSGR